VSIALSVISKVDVCARHAVGLQNASNVGGDALVHQHTRGKVDGNGRAKAGLAPRCPLLHRFVQHVQSEIAYLIAHLCNRDEFIRMDHSVFGMVPSGERLDAVNAPLPQVDDGLIMHFDLAAAIASPSAVANASRRGESRSSAGE
jgi:hypothetical protein